MSNANWPTCAKLVLSSEGGYWDDPKGGPTMNGVTQSTYDSYRINKGLEKQSVKLLTDTERLEIYKIGYWDAVKGDLLPSGLDYMAFDYAINSGPQQAAKDLQRVLNVVADGAIGQKTIQAANVAMSNGGDKVTIPAYTDRRWALMKVLKNFAENERGWRARLDKVQAGAMAMAAKAVAGPFDSAPMGVSEPVGASLDVPATYPLPPMPRALPRNVRVLKTLDGQGVLIATIGLLGSVIPRERWFYRNASLNDAIYYVIHSYSLLAIAVGLGAVTWCIYKKRVERAD